MKRFSIFSRKRPPRATVAGMVSVALSSVLPLCGAGSVPVKNLLPQGTMQGDLDAGGHNVTNAATVSAGHFVGNGSGLTNVQPQPAWTTVDATMVNTTGTDGNPAFALAPGSNYVVDQVTNGPFELALPDPATATNLPIRIRDANNSIGTAGCYTVTNDAGGTGNGFLWYAAGETDLSAAGATQAQIGNFEDYGEMVFRLGTDAEPQSIWVANETTTNARLNCDASSNFSVVGGSSIMLGNGVLHIVTDPQGSGGGTLHIPTIAGAADSTFMVQGLYGGTYIPSGYMCRTDGSGGLSWYSPSGIANFNFNSIGYSGASYGSNTLTIKPQLYAGSYAGTGSATSSFVVTIGTTQVGTTYKVNVTPTAALTAAPFYISAKTTTTFTVTYLTGLTGTVTFDWSVFP